MEPIDPMQFVLLLTETPGVGDRTLATILRRNAVLRRTPEDCLALSAARWRDEYGLRKETAANLAQTGSRRAATQETARCLRRQGVVVMTLSDATYPSRLLYRLEDPPPVLFAYGDPALLDASLFAVANSNDAPETALAAGDAAACAGMEQGWWPVTGHNRPAYQRSALVSRRRGGRVCYILDRGLLEAFNGDLTRELFAAAHIWSAGYDPARDLTLSPFGLRDHALAVHNRRRDDIVFALADRIFAGSVRPGGQMERACFHALAQDRPVCLVGPPSAGDEGLLAAGARRVKPEEIPLSCRSGPVK